MRILRWIFRGIDTIIVLSLIIIFLPNIFFKSYEVTSGSMEPTIPTGSVVYVQDAEEIQKGDIIAFTAKKDEYCIHRCIDIINNKYQTKGDNNVNPDVNLVDPRNVIGKEAYHIPYVAYVIEIARTPAAIVIIAAIFIVSVILELKPVHNKKILI